ncbi:MAG TPA: S-layer protein domain-containing protein [Candidatus Methanoperedens sp.]
MLRNVSTLFLSLLFITSIGQAANDILLNNTDLYLATGEPKVLDQGYVLTVKSVSSDGSVWLQLSENDTIVKSEIVRDYGYLTYNKTKRKILSVKINKIYSGSMEQSLVAMSVYQFIDPDKPLPANASITPSDAQKPGNSSSSPNPNNLPEPLIWTSVIVFILILFYLLRKLW